VRGEGFARAAVVTTEDYFQRMLDRNPEPGESSHAQTRQVFADWLQDQGDPRADGYRLLGALGLAPFCSGVGNRDSLGRLPTREALPWGWSYNDTGRPYGYHLPYSWYVHVVKVEVQYVWGTREQPLFETRRAADDAAAIALQLVHPSRWPKLPG
jgi:uncharacterized protein (TIGR02996 family)